MSYSFLTMSQESSAGPSRLELIGEQQTYLINAAEPIAYGRLCVLFAARTTAGKQVCLKLFRGSLQADDGDADFSRELYIVRELKHPAILPILDFGISSAAEPRLFLVLPLCSRGNLRSLLRERSFVPMDAALSYLRDIASALDYSHRQGVIHGDVKPENVLLTDENRAALSDFGAAKYRLRGWNEQTTKSGAFSEFYASPEQIGTGRQSVRSDTYSFAMIAYELLTGKPPIDMEAPIYHQMKAKMDGRLIDALEANPALPPGVADALARGLSLTPSARWGSAGELVLAIEHGFNSPTSAVRRSQAQSRDVFVVHGRDVATKEEVARLLERLGLNPIVLHEMASAGRSVIEKIEAYANVAAAIVLLTPDDIGALASQSDLLRPRARQNVVFELGYFCARLGRDRTIALYNEVELPSDLAGIVYVALDSGGAWRVELIRELRAAGLDVDANDAFT